MGLYKPCKKFTHYPKVRQSPLKDFVKKSDMNKFMLLFLLWTYKGEDLRGNIDLS